MNGQCFHAEGIYECVCRGWGQIMPEPVYQVIPKVTPRWITTHALCTDIATICVELCVLTLFSIIQPFYFGD